MSTIANPHIPKNYPEKYKPYRNISTVAYVLDKYEAEFSIRPVRQGKENKFAIEDGLMVTIGDLWETLFGSSPAKKRRDKMELSQYERQDSKKAVKKKKASAKRKSGDRVTYKDMVREMIAKDMSEADIKTGIIDRYVLEGKDKAWAVKRSKAIYADISTEAVR